MGFEFIQLGCEGKAEESGLSERPGAGILDCRWFGF